ncbi:imidazolonepropionase [Mycobacteroides abscessus]|uniref:imidazolonepropionase n=1 Tax=Mycobacteroides abscessus TaxID=36809 RepID=UPI00092923FD|nr:imidazolonepropionase [Mycobacteroides abscessus]SHR30992.1 Imidazolonepropionase [Mycobacteroides abscessus subsp. bolletii]SHT33019.1 Imidazolonepropionase [Mycobacteroides abscessus subsp. bolletii]SHT51251.1 Imidazolonepropionase [Mycobacteroides abscessus subsp. bolletii]SKG64498.1 Imidazolonepropionase [Mycobacteroides abscessus subsp. bolletii]SKH19635.1 Imidazolonepropionase [Mycobacteroides abscessus subsp. bolletii]
MTTTLYDNIAELVTNDPTAGDHSPLGIITDAALVVDGTHIAWVGPCNAAPDTDHRVDCESRSVIPGFVDSHAHLVFDGDRAGEFAARMAGQPYDGGGIATTVAATRQATDAALAATVARLSHELRNSGVTTFETKSGYGLTVHDETRSLHLASDFTTETTFLGAHVVPAEYTTRRDAYVELVRTTMLDACAPHARWIDVFCDRGAFDVYEARAILTAGIARGLRPRLHASQLERGDGILLAVELDAASVDHCTYATDEDLEALAGSSTVATLLPGAEFSTRAQWPNGRRFLDAGVTVALATDCNPGSSYTTSMPLCIALAVRDMHLTPAEALWSATAGGAAALRRTDIGTLEAGRRADFVILAAPTYLHLAYRPGVNLIETTVVNGNTTAPFR